MHIYNYEVALVRHLLTWDSQAAVPSSSPTLSEVHCDVTHVINTNMKKKNYFLTQVPTRIIVTITCSKKMSI